MKTSKNLQFSDVFKGYRSGTSVENGLSLEGDSSVSSTTENSDASSVNSLMLTCKPYKEVLYAILYQMLLINSGQDHELY